MILIDTSVWIRYLSGQEPFLSAVTKLVLSKETAAHELVYGELLIGEKGGRRARFLTDYEELRFCTRVPHSEVVSLVWRRRLNGRGIGWIDVHLIASALADRMQFWTADPRLANIAEEFGVTYKIPAL